MTIRREEISRTDLSDLAVPGGGPASAPNENPARWHCLSPAEGERCPWAIPVHCLMAPGSRDPVTRMQSGHLGRF